MSVVRNLPIFRKHKLIQCLMDNIVKFTWKLEIIELC